MEFAQPLRLPGRDGRLAAFADLLLPARHGVAKPQEMPALWRAKLTDGYTLGNYSYLTYADEGES